MNELEVGTVLNESTSESSEMKSPPTAHRLLFVSLRALCCLLTFGVLTFSLLATPSTADGTGTNSAALSLAKYAVDTAIHSQEPRVVAPGDIVNAVNTPTLNTTKLVLQFNIRQLPGFTWQIGLSVPGTFQTVCVAFPNRIGGTPTIVKCSPKAAETLSYGAVDLAVSRNAIAAAARHDRAVSGANVVEAALASGVHLRERPTFSAGGGGTADFVTMWKAGTKTESLDVCVLFPKSAFGIPSLAPC